MLTSVLFMARFRQVKLTPIVYSGTLLKVRFMLTSILFMARFRQVYTDLRFMHGSVYTDLRFIHGSV
jgi:hypothetical protein